MMALPAWITTHKGDATRSTFWLVKVGLATPVYLTDCDQPIVYDGHTFAPAPLTVDGVQSDASSASGNGGKLTLATGGPYWQPLVSEIAGGSRAFEITFWEAWLNVLPLSPVPEAVRLVAVTRAEAAEWDSEQIALTLGPSADPALGRLPFREYSQNCTYRDFKGAQCGYSGAATACDRTATTCLSLSNLTRFGGFLNLPPENYVAVWNWQTGGIDYTASVSFRRRSA